MLRASSGRLVGRDSELTRLLGLLDDASDGRPSHALISGDAGVGKTRLVAELAARAADRGFLVLSGRCAELGDSIPYLPLADALREGTSDSRRRNGTARGRAGRPAGPGPSAAGPGPGGAAGRGGLGTRPAAAVRGGARAARRAGRRASGAADPGGPALGRPLDPRPGHVPEPGAAPGTGGRGGHLSHRRPAPAPPAPAGGRGAAAAAQRGLDRAGAAGVRGDGRVT